VSCSAGWGKFRPFAEYSDAESAPWLATAVEAIEHGWPAPVRDRIEVNTTRPGGLTRTGARTGRRFRLPDGDV
jgi:hypothetical protein